MEENNKETPELPPTEQLAKEPVVAKKTKLSLPIIIIGLFIILTVAVGGFLFLSRGSRVNKSYTNPSKTIISQTPSQSQIIPVPTDFPSVTLQGKIVYINNDNLWINDNGNVKQLTNDAIHTKIPYWTGLPKLWYSNPQISPNGRLIAFLKNSGDNTYNRSLYIIGTDGNGMRKLSDNVDWGDSLLQWSKDSNSIFYTYNHTNHVEMIGEAMKIYSASLITGNNEEVGNYIVKNGGCGGGSDDAADHLTENEGLASVGGGTTFFQISSSNDSLIHTVNCFATGTGLLNLSTHKDQLLNSDAGKATLSPLGAMIAAATDKILIFDAKTGTLLKTLSPLGSPTNLLWSPDEKSIYYVSVTSGDIITTPNSDTLGSTRINTSTIRKISLITQKDEEIAHFDAHNIKLVYIQPDNSVLIASLIENSTKLHNYMIQNKNGDNIVQHYPSVNLIEINLANGKFNTFIKGAQQSSYLP